MFEGKLVRLRAVSRDDLPRYVSWINDQEVAGYLSFPRPISVDDEKRWFATASSNPSESLFSLDTAGGEHIGSTALRQIDPRSRNAMLSILIGDKRFWGRGCGTEAVTLMLEFGFDQLNLHRVALHVFDYNHRAMRCYEKCGFVREGTLRQAGYKHGRYFDILVMGILGDEFRRLRSQA